MKLTRTTRNAGWLVVAGLLGAALIAPGSVFATDLKDSHVGTRWDATGFACPNEDKDLAGPGEVVWHFVLTSPDKSSGHLTATFKIAGTIRDVADTPKGGDKGALQWYVTTGYDTLLGAETTDVEGNNLVLSHICVGETTTTTTTTDAQTTDTQTTGTQTTGTQTTGTQTTGTQTTTSVTGSISGETGTQTTTSVTGSISGETGKPTPPSTDAVDFSSTSSTTGSGWSLLLIAMAGLLAGALLLTPAAAARKR